VIAYKTRRDAAHEAALDELAAEAQNTISDTERGRVSHGLHRRLRRLRTVPGSAQRLTPSRGDD
jgi:hypothetical protein